MKIYGIFLTIFLAVTGVVHGQRLQRDFPLAEKVSIEIVNLYGRVEVSTVKTEENEAGESVKSNQPKQSDKASLTAENARETDLKIVSEKNLLQIIVQPIDAKSRVDLNLKIPERLRVSVETNAGEVRISGNLLAAEVRTETGTISTDVPTDDLKYDFVWTESRPRFLSDVELKKVKEKAGGKFVVSGKLGGKAEKEIEKNSGESEDADRSGDEQATANEKQKNKGQISLNFTTARGIILLNVPLNEVSPDLRERPLTEAAKAVVKSGDGLLTEAIRRASPKYFGEYVRTLPPLKQEPILRKGENTLVDSSPVSTTKRVIVRVTDLNNRSISDLRIADFDVTERGEQREILSVEPASAPFNLVLLLDVSGSIDNYVDYLRKAARQFVETAGKDDRIAIVIFNEDVKTLSTFTTDKNKLSASLDTFDAGGGTAFYDSIGYILTDTLRPLKGERTAVVALTDGDDNRSFLPFDSLLGSIQESGALFYPLYVPSDLIAASANGNSAAIDPLRNRYMSLTTKASGEGEKLAQISGGVYYPISQLSQIQTAYTDIIRQLRTAYTVTFRSQFRGTKENQASPRIRVRVKRENTFVNLGSVTEVSMNDTKNAFTQSATKAVIEIKDYRASDFIKSPANSFSGTENFSINSLVSYARFAPSEIFFHRQANEISGEVERVSYKQFANDNLRETKFENFDINAAPGAFLLADGAEKIAVSRWISPKRTRSYPYERVYDTLVFPKRVTVIPVLKDEGLGGERDFLQWDTISLMSLLDVFVVPAYYGEATKNEKRADQITAQKLDKDYVSAKLKEIFAFKGTARQWNEAQSKQLKAVFERARDAYREISKQTKTYLHDESALNELIKLAENPINFAEFSRRKSRRGQSRELQSIQPKEALSTDTKGGVTITNLAGGKYFFTCDETRLENDTLYLIEAKHSQRAMFPSENDIKDGFLKMMIYTNLKNVRVGKTPVKSKSVIRLTSSKLAGSINSNDAEENTAKFFLANSLSISQTNLIKKLFHEARENKFTIIIEHAEVAK